MTMLTKSKIKKIVDALDELEIDIPTDYDLEDCINDFGMILCDQELALDGSILDIRASIEFTEDNIASLDDCLEKFGVDSDDERFEILREILDDVFDIDIEDIVES